MTTAAADLPEQALTALALTAIEGVVLSLVLAEQEVTFARVVDATGVSSSLVSKAIAVLERKGLLDRVPGRRPTVVFLHAGAAQSLTALVREAHEAQTATNDALAALGEQVAHGVARAHERGRPFF